MKASDFFRRGAETPLHATVMTAGVHCRIRTNSSSILAAAQSSFLSCPTSSETPQISARLWIDNESRSQFPLPKPYVRGLDHLVFAAFDPSSSILVDLNKKHALGRFSRDLEFDSQFWKSIFFPIFMSVIGGSIGVAELHGSCVVKNKRGLFLLGSSHSGKSTLATAFAFAGFEFLSDDRVYCAVRNGTLQAWGIPNFLKLRPEAQSWFPELKLAKTVNSLDGEPAVLLKPELQSNIKSAQHCEPAMLIFLDQQKSDCFDLSEASRSDVAQWVDRELMAEPWSAIEEQRKVVDQLSRISCWHLHYGGNPAAIAARLTNHFEALMGGARIC